MAVDAAVALIPEADPVLVEELGEAAAVCGEIEENVKEAPGLDPPNWWRLFFDLGDRVRQVTERLTWGIVESM